MNISGLKPAFLVHGPNFWVAWDADGIGILAYPACEEYLRVQGLLENMGFWDVHPNSALAGQIRENIVARQNNFD